MQRVMAAVQRVLRAHDPYPGVVLNRTWDVVGANAGALALLEGVPAHLLQPVPNIIRLSLHPDGMAARTTNLAAWAGHLLAQLDRAAAVAADPALVALAEEVRGYPGIADLPAPDPDGDPQILLGVGVDTDAGHIELFTTLTTFGTPQDVTIDELVIELFYPADAATEAILRGRAGT